MASYSVVIKPGAQAEFLTVPFPFRRQINQRIYALKNEPRPAASETVDERTRVLRVEGWRLVYEVDDDRHVISVLAVLPPAQ